MKPHKLTVCATVAERDSGDKTVRGSKVDRAYYLSSHVEEEMAADEFERADVEHAIFKGRIEKKLTHDERGTRYRIEGLAQDGRMMQVICRFKADSNLVIITVYALVEEV